MSWRRWHSACRVQQQAGGLPLNDGSTDDLASRFQQSEAALTEARMRLEKLGSAQEQASTSAAALSESAEAVRAFSAEAQEAAALLGQSQTLARSVLERGVELLDGSELRELRKAVDGLSTTMEQKLDSLAARVADVERAQHERDLAQKQLAHIKANVSDRHLKKALESLPSQVEVP